MKQYDAIIIGFGKAGKTLAAELSNRGWQVAVVERSSMMYGGTCPNIACIPTKTLVHEAGIAALLYHDDYPKQANLYKQAIGRKNRLTSFLRNNNYERLSKRPNVTVYTGEGSFVSANIIKVALPEGDIELQGKEIFINTGSTPIIPAIDGIKESQKVYTSTTLLDLNVLPQRLIIVGGGYIGLEFASMYAEFGSKVTLLEGGNRFMPRNDQDIANSVKEVLEKKGIEIHLNARAQSIHDTNDGVTLTYSDVSDGTPYFVDGDAILIATGRKPMIEGLNLQAAGIGVDAHGAIVVNDQLRTTVPHVWAMGDVKGGPQFTYLSLDDFRIIRDQLFGDKKRDIGDRDPVPYAVFIDPPLAHIGLTEEEALKRGYSFKVSRLPATSVVRSRTLKQTDGMLKAIVNDHSGKIMGCTLFCAEAPEILHWDRNSRFCSACGTPMEQKEDIMKRCPKCGREVYPSISTAILVLVRKEDSLLLVHARNFKGTFNSLVAGFLETGETLEECVAREVKEETGLDVTNITYFGNQTWPYPSGLMVGFIADYAGGEIKLQEEELSSGDFYTRDNLPELPRKLSLARKMIDWWLECSHK